MRLHSVSVRGKLKEMLRKQKLPKIKPVVAKAKRHVPTTRAWLRPNTFLCGATIGTPHPEMKTLRTVVFGMKSSGASSVMSMSLSRIHVDR
jgi:hypothetical protein